MGYTLVKKDNEARTIMIIQGKNISDKTKPTYTKGFSEEDWQKTEQELINLTIEAWEKSEE